LYLVIFSAYHHSYKNGGSFILDRYSYKNLAFFFVLKYTFTLLIPGINIMINTKEHIIARYTSTSSVLIMYEKAHSKLMKCVAINISLDHRTPKYQAATTLERDANSHSSDSKPSNTAVSA
jgi:hypothetical protein